MNWRLSFWLESPRIKPPRGVWANHPGDQPADFQVEQAAKILGTCGVAAALEAPARPKSNP